MADKLSYLESQQMKDVANLLHFFPEVTWVMPGKCSIMKHDTELLPSELSPIRETAYQVIPRKNKKLQSYSQIIWQSLVNPYGLHPIY